ncbi:hypothetical protein B0H16DRAFT_1885883 [Mycena metata]|uniref:Uncharacterized protein n=1 Tax=Mycena metata TaxID=1033252 RepID=A0AAD7J4K8_9AGAR|nr:hypothetical protein B0H16DRAFT_1885883 [Mycena metata]
MEGDGKQPQTNNRSRPKMEAPEDKIIYVQKVTNTLRTLNQTTQPPQPLDFPKMSAIFASPASVAPSISTSSISSVTPPSRRGSLRERCGFTLWLSFGPALPPIRAKGALEPTVGNLPRRKRSSVVSLDLPDPERIVAAHSQHMEYFA